MYDDTGALKEAYYGSGSAGAMPAAPSSSGGNFLSTMSNVLGAVNPVLGIASGVLGGIFQNKANKANIQMQRETNALNYRMFNEANQFSERMWHMQNEYNTPEAQAQRLKAAGINPAFVFGNGSISEAGGINSASPPNLQAPRVDPYNPVPAAQTAIDAFMQSQINSAQIKMMHENERHLSIQNDLDYIQAVDKIHSMRIDNQQKEQYLKWFMGTRGLEYDLMTANKKKLDADTENQYAQAMAATLHSQFERAMTEAHLKFNDAQINQISQTIAQGWSHIQQEAQRIGIERESVENQREWYIDQAWHLLKQDKLLQDQLGLQREMMWSNQFKNVLGGVIPVVIGAGLGIAGRYLGPARTIVSGFR